MFEVFEGKGFCHLISLPPLQTHPKFEPAGPDSNPPGLTSRASSAITSNSLLKEVHHNRNVVTAPDVDPSGGLGGGRHLPVFEESPVAGGFSAPVPDAQGQCLQDVYKQVLPFPLFHMSV